MAQETIEAVRSAELTAEQMEKDAAAESEKIIANAHVRARESYASMTEKAKSKARANLETAQRQGDSIIANAISQVEKELEMLRKTAQEKEHQAIQLILSELI